MRQLPLWCHGVLLTMTLSLLLGAAPHAIAQPGEGAPQHIAEAEAPRIGVFVTGSVNKPGAFEVTPATGLLELLALAGGAEPGAALTKVTIMRDGLAITVNVLAAMRPEAARPAFNLRDGDIIVVPRNTSRVIVMGDVNRPGEFTLPEEGAVTAAELLARAGGLKWPGKPHEIALIRSKGPNHGYNLLLLDEFARRLPTLLQKDDIIVVTKPGQARQYLRFLVERPPIICWGL